jgi:hypothetical protein
VREQPLVTLLGVGTRGRSLVLDLILELQATAGVAQPDGSADGGQGSYRVVEQAPPEFARGQPRLGETGDFVDQVVEVLPG